MAQLVFKLLCPANFSLPIIAFSCVCSTRFRLLFVVVLVVVVVVLTRFVFIVSAIRWSIYGSVIVNCSPRQASPLLVNRLGGDSQLELRYRSRDRIELALSIKRNNFNV